MLDILMRYFCVFLGRGAHQPGAGRGATASGAAGAGAGEVAGGRAARTRADA